MSDPGPYTLCGGVHAVRVTPVRAHDLVTLHAGIERAEPASLFFHLVQPALRAPASRERPPDDLSAWVGGVLQRPDMAERLAHAARQGAGVEERRRSLLAALAKAGTRAAVDEEAAFTFHATDSVLAPLAEVATPEELVEQLACADAAVWFWHLLEEPWRADGPSPLAGWLRAHGAPELAVPFEQAAASTRSLDALRREVVTRWRRTRLARRVAFRHEAPDAERVQEAAREAARLAHELVRRHAP